jgi:primase-polymerase (primpol)-like protein
VRYAPDKRPLTVRGHAASSTDPATWASYAEAVGSRAGVGLGFVLGDGIGCIDIDHCLTGNELSPQALELLARYPRSYTEISPSGDGIHIWGTADPAPGSKRIENGLSIERYSTGRYITVTGNVLQHGSLQPL